MNGISYMFYSEIRVINQPVSLRASTPGAGNTCLLATSWGAVENPTVEREATFDVTLYGGYKNS